jgi:short-subunit dehydrogenase
MAAMPKAIITGASAGIGAALARRLARERYDLVLVARRDERLRVLAGELEKAHGIKVEVVKLDVTDPAAGKILVEKAGDADLLVNNAGYGNYSPAVDIPVDVATGMVRVNCEALTGILLAFLPRMVARKSGTILNLASIAAFQPIPYLATYAASKAYVLSLSVGIDAEVKRHGVRVLAICPGPVPTEFQGIAGTPPDHAAAFLKVTAEQVAEDALWMIRKGKRVFVPNIFLRTAMLLEKFLPRDFVVWMAGRSISKEMRAAEAAAAAK